MTFMSLFFLFHWFYNKVKACRGPIELKNKKENAIEKTTVGK